MDPEATLARWRSAIEDGDEEEAFEAAYDLRGWIDRGGFMPKFKDSAEYRSMLSDARSWRG